MTSGSRRLRVSPVTDRSGHRACASEAWLALGTVQDHRGLLCSQNHAHAGHCGQLSDWMDAPEAVFSMLGNSIADSPNAQMICNVYPESRTGLLRDWLLGTVQRAQSKRQILPSNEARSKLSSAIIESPGFQDCIKQNAGTLVLRGNMGSGKSTTMCYFIHYLEGREDIAVASVLFDIESPSEQDVCKVLMRFVQQLADLEDGEHNKILLNMSKRYPDSCPPARQTADALTAIIKWTSQRKNDPRKKATCFILDGLDEFKNERELHQLLNHLRNIQAQTECGVILSSRWDIAGITTFFGSGSTAIVHAHTSDIRGFIKNAVLSHAVQDLLKECPRYSDKIYEAVIEGSHEL